MPEIEVSRKKELEVPQVAICPATPQVFFYTIKILFKRIKNKRKIKKKNFFFEQFKNIFKFSKESKSLWAKEMKGQSQDKTVEFYFKVCWKISEVFCLQT